ncbi:hypothetical protein FZC84_14000 [Rossellomorea vietnamensis]|uniref:Lipoprotein n=1 Tax=Rossellomorea vietnamensis TaxID=218284 RepID=A0A5D4MAD9_9BACI|nr:hypothetical protein [Rossellomorea vietnamensis]TYR98541.1 hypothetical protein FZC84_14000 [Rossellomorea vietnamensis]
MYRVFLMLALLLLLSGCRIELSLDEAPPDTGGAAQSSVPSSEANTVKKNESLSVFINGEIDYDESQIRLMTETDLQEGAVLKVQLKQYPKDAALRDIFNGEVELVETPVLEETMEVDSNGGLDVTLERESDIVYFLTVQFNPELQPDDIKEVYGSRGENIVVSSNVEHYEHEGQTMIGASASANIGMRPSWSYLQ